MNRGNENKNRALGMPYGTANGKLKKLLLFNFSQALKLDTCFRCSLKIQSIEDFSIDHKISWLFSENPVIAFFDPQNIAFSHLICNVKAANNTGPRIKDSKRMVGGPSSLCTVCRAEKPTKSFGNNASKRNGLATECKTCRSDTRRRAREV